MQTYDPEIKESDNVVTFPFLSSSSVQVEKEEREMKLAKEEGKICDPVTVVLQDDPMILVMDNVLTPDECQELVTFINDYEQIRQGNYNRKKLIINCSALSQLFLDRLHDYLPHTLFSQGGSKCRRSSSSDDPTQTWSLDTINPAWRMVKGTLQSKLPRHFDGSYVKTIDYRSLYTVLVYLIDSDGDTRFYYNPTSNCTGTATTQFPNSTPIKQIDIKPKQGRFVIFHQSIEHEGLINCEMEKYFMRSEMMYRRTAPLATEKDVLAMQKYQQARECFYTDVDRSERLEIEAFRLCPMLEDLILGV
jgi:hypothetical protein